MLTFPIQTTFSISRHPRNKLLIKELYNMHTVKGVINPSGASLTVRTDEKKLYTTAENIYLLTWMHLSPSEWLQLKCMTWKDRSIWLAHSIPMKSLGSHVLEEGDLFYLFFCFFLYRGKNMTTNISCVYINPGWRF